MKKNMTTVTALICFLVSLLPSCSKPSDDRKIIIGPDGGKTVEVLSLEGTERDNWQIYQVNPKLYGSSGAYAKIEARLDEIKALGTEILYLMPVYEEGMEKSIGSPYCIKNFKALNANYGTMQELRSLVDAAHSRGMKVMFDWVANHTAWDNAWVSEHPDWYEKDAQGNIVCPTKDGTWSDVAQLNYSNTELWDAMEDALLYWVKELGIDGYRCDYAHGVKDAFWQDAIGKLKKQYPSLIMLAESDYERMFNDGFDIIFDRAMKRNMIALFKGGKVADFFNWYSSDLAKTPSPKTKLFFITNHDDATENYPAGQFSSSEGGLAAYVLMSALNGSSMVYGSQETGYSKTINFFKTMTFDWSAGSAIHNAYQQALSALSGLDRSGKMKAYYNGRVIFISYPNGLVAVNVDAAASKAGLPDVNSSLPSEVSLSGYGTKIWTW